MHETFTLVLSVKEPPSLLILTLNNFGHIFHLVYTYMQRWASLIFFLSPLIANPLIFRE